MVSRDTIATREGMLGALVFVVSAAVSSVILWSSGDHGQTGFPLDDAWIHLVYGRSVAEGGYPAYNSGVPSTGSTSPLWAYVLGLLHVTLRQTALVVWGVKIVGIVLHGATAFLSFRLVSRMTSSAWSGSLAGVFLGACPVLAATALSGMEIPLGCALCLGGIHFFLKERWRMSGVLLGLAGLARPEFGAVILVLAGDAILRVMKGRGARGGFVKFAAPVALFACLFVGWNLAVDGRPFPATFYAKAMPVGSIDWAQRLAAGFKMITRSAPLHAGILALGVLGLVLVKGAARRWATLFLLCGGVYFAANLSIIPPYHPEAFYHIRYLLPAVPLLFVGAMSGIALGSRALWKSLHGRQGRLRRAEKAAYFTLLGVIVVLLAVWTVSGGRFWTTKYSRDCRNINEVQVTLGKAIARGMSEDARVGTIDAGAIRYFGGRFTVDLMGLNTPSFSDADCRGKPLDALVLMPAWVRLPSTEDLVPVLVRETYDYQVTANPAMGRQLITVCRSDSSTRKRGLSFEILRKTRGVCMRCLSPTEVDRLAKSLARE